MEGYGYYQHQLWYPTGERHHEYRRLIHDLSKKLSHDNVQSISFLRSPADCCDHPACAHIAAVHQHPTNRGLELLERLWQNGVFSETNLQPLVQLLRDIGRHDLADEFCEKSSKLYYDHHRFRQAPPIPVPPPQLQSPSEWPVDRDGSNGRDQESRSTDDAEAVIGQMSLELNSPLTASAYPKASQKQRDIITSSAAASSTTPVDNATNPMSKSIPTQSTGFDNANITSLSTTAPEGHQLFPQEGGAVPLTLNKAEIHKLLQCIEKMPDSDLKQKLMTAASSNSHYSQGERLQEAVPPDDASPKIVLNSRNQMASEANDFNSQTTANSACRPEISHQTHQKVVLRHQMSVPNFNNSKTDVSIPNGPLTPQPQRRHRKLEACDSNSSDSGLSQCQSKRSSTISNTSMGSSAFLSEEEETKDGGNHLTVAARRQQNSDEAALYDAAVRKNFTKVQVEEKRRAVSQTEDDQVTAVKHRLNDRVKRKPRRQSESVRDNPRDSHHPKEGHHKPHNMKRNRTISLPEFPRSLTKSAHHGMMVDWKIPRDDFIDPIFHHRNRSFEKKCRFSTGSGSSILNVQLAIRLYPNGINWDQGSYSTLKVEVTNTSRPPPHTAYIQFDVTGYDCHAGHVIASRQVEYPLKNKEFLVPEFLSHEVIKVSHAKHFEFRATIKIKYLVCRDWVVIATEPACCT